ncbi:MAG: hypothetical protein ACF8R9_07605 [Phycisphaerales bacterium JB054]
MIRASFFNAQASNTGQQAARVVTVIQSQPSWVLRAALTVAFLTLTGILLVVVIPAVLIATVLFLALALCRRVWLSLRSALGIDRTGRRNVRVIVRD